MASSMEVILEIVRDPRHPFRKLTDRQTKPQKNRYERRKIKQFLQFGHWAAEAAQH